MKSFRVPRLQEELKKMFNIILSQKLRDPKLAWVNVTDVVISKDLRYAKVYFSHYNNPGDHQEIRDLLYKTSGFFKKQIAGAHLMRTIPELSFYYDDTEDRAAKVDALLTRIKDNYDDEDDSDYDPDIDIDDFLDDDDYYDIDEEEDYEDEFDDDDEEEE
ncbi:MAG: 30S ribosome-binding factor RbfA [Candidatus Cloacimonetes bacterium]|nr:30S ribosome-binding factor RbfA [Candidatus Cloacimonadota bacterium]HNZ06867.1 30S ribosome-binding factor RbfA [Candidatus Cloacimonadota bacterium]HOH78635.1 30S ribosome-binding factor RbfA [Candidatus Cloacimonadota bacterium]HPN40846.1 30S ribosome-binding factor RbfA [Candidatus Cloacimonadota bacterium]